MPFFSVIIPLFNKREYIEGTIRSVLVQAHASFEVIVVDDGSSDGSTERVAAISDHRLRHIDQANAGPGVARNRGVEEASGEWVAFLDADDLWFPSHLSALVRLIDAFPDADAVATSFRRASSENAALITPAPRVLAKKLNYFAEAAQRETVCSSTIAIRRQTFKDLGGFNPRFPGEDIDLWARLACDHTIAFSDEVTAIYRTYASSFMRGGDAVTPPEEQPIFDTLGKALRNDRYRRLHAEIRNYRASLLKGGAKNAFYHGRMEVARSYLKELGRHGDDVPMLFRLLARMPGFPVAMTSRIYSVFKRNLDQED